MGYSKTNWQNGTTKANATNMNKIEDELEKLDPATPYTQATGTYTTATYGDGTTTCTWTAPRTGLYLMFASFYISDNDNDKAKVYKQFQLKGTATKITGEVLFYQTGPGESSSLELSYQAVKLYNGCALIYATQGQTIIPRIFTSEAGIVWDVKLTGLFLK